MDQVEGRKEGPTRDGVANVVPTTTTPPVTLEAAKLFSGRDEVRLLHRGQEYRLRVTKQGKLILTK